MRDHIVYESPAITELGGFGTETGEFVGPCEETWLPFNDYSCPA
ncbi:hypothetical protein [Nonomuraea candida]|nr:hypothetical protein [Nonomuraea candida]